MAKDTSKVEWRLPKFRLSANERVVLEYLTEHADDCAIERTPMALAVNCSPSGVGAMAHISKTVRNLHVMGLVEKMRRFGVQFWNRVREDGVRDENEGTFVDGGAADESVFNSDRACAVFQALAVAAPDGISRDDLGSRVLCGEGPGPISSTLRLLRAAGYVEEFKLKGKVWITDKGMAHWASMKNKPERSKIILDYLIENQGEPHKCRKAEIYAAALGKIPDVNVRAIDHHIKPILKDLMDKGLIYAVQHPREHWIWFRVKGTTKKTRKEKNNDD